MAVTAYRDRVLSAIDRALPLVQPAARTALDFGSGDGFFCAQLRERGLSVTPVDVVERAHSLVAPQLYDGGALPFPDRCFDLAYAIDVLHHCPDPRFAIAELTRCSAGWLLIKDHNCDGAVGHFALAVLDELGNRRFGIPSPGRYQRAWGWLPWIEGAGFERVQFSHPLHCHVGPLGTLTNGLQFIGLWRRR